VQGDERIALPWIAGARSVLSADGTVRVFFFCVCPQSRGLVPETRVLLYGSIHILKLAV